MCVLVIGAGIIGSIFGWALAESGHQVVHLVRSGRAATLRDGVRLDMFDRRKRHKRNFFWLYHLDAVETLSPTDSFELVIVPVKHYALTQTLKEIVPLADKAVASLKTEKGEVGVTRATIQRQPSKLDVAGSSVGSYVDPSFLQITIKAGLSPAEALRTATSNPARFLGREKELGTVESGRLADLVLLDANPLDNIN